MMNKITSVALHRRFSAIRCYISNMNIEKKKLASEFKAASQAPTCSGSYHEMQGKEAKNFTGRISSFYGVWGSF